MFLQEHQEHSESAPSVPRAARNSGCLPGTMELKLLPRRSCSLNFSLCLVVLVVSPVSWDGGRHRLPGIPGDKRYAESSGSLFSGRVSFYCHGSVGDALERAPRGASFLWPCVGTPQARLKRKIRQFVAGHGSDVGEGVIASRTG